MVKYTKIVAGAVLILAIAFFVPPLVDTTETDQQQTLEVREGTDREVTDNLETAAIAVNTTADTATIEVSNTRTLNSSQVSLNLTETKSATVDGETVRITLESTREDGRGQYAISTYRYPSTFGFNDAAKRFLGNMPLLLTLISFIIVLGLIGAILND